MAIKRNSCPITLEHYLDCRDKIVSRAEGARRKFVEENFVIKAGKLVQKSKAEEKKKAPTVVASKDPVEDKNEYLNFLSTNLGFIQETTKSIDQKGNLSPTRFNPIQAYLMNTNLDFVWVNKTRQFGFSFVLAARALSKAMLQLKHTSIFVSYNEEESKEKIVYARELYESMPMKWQLSRKLKYDNKTSLVFEKSGKDSFETRILSYPQRAVRGKGGELEIALDEFAHCIHARKIYTSATPALSRGSRSSLVIGSSPAGKSGLFYEIGVNYENNYPVFSRIFIPWWVVPEFCVDTVSAKIFASDMDTDERVKRFGTKRIQAIRRSMTKEDFMQEYECEYLDETYSYFPWSLIQSCVPIFDAGSEDVPNYDAPASDLNQIDSAKVGVDYYTDFDSFLYAVHNGMFSGSILGGFDVGRMDDASEIVYIEEDPNTFHHIVRCNIQLKNISFPEQRRIVVDQFNRLGDRLIKFGVDNNGIGMNIAEDLEELSYEKVAKLPFNSNDWKEQACRRIRMRMEKKKISYPTDRRILNQIHSIKRVLLPSKAWRFDADENAKHHGDKFWAIIAASEMGHPLQTELSIEAQFDRRVVSGIQGKPMRPQPTMIYTPSFENLMKFNPYGDMPSLSIGFEQVRNQRRRNKERHSLMQRDLLPN